MNKSSKNKPHATARFFPQSQRRLWHRRRRSLQLRTGVGVIKLEVLYGQDPFDRHWGCPMRERWGLSGHQQLSPAMEEKLCFTLTATGTYEQAAEVAAKWGSPTDDSTLHALAQRMGRRAEEQAQLRLETVPQEQQSLRAASALAVLMIDGWLARQRGEGWGKKRTRKERVEWHEIKTGVFYRQEQSSRSQSGRGLLADKRVVSWQGEAMELGRRLRWEALREGLGRARKVLAVGDGAPWIWNLVEDRFKGAAQLLDFYHASQHLWAIGRALEGEAGAASWVEPRLHHLRHGQEAAVLAELGQLKGRAGEAGAILRREQNYFAGHARRMNYQKSARQGWPIGSGAVESACRQRQCRFKRPGQFWTRHGLRHLLALEEARHNGHWDPLWKNT